MNNLSAKLSKYWLICGNMKMLCRTCTILVVVNIVFKTWIEQFTQLVIAVSKYKTRNQVFTDINKFQDPQCFMQRISTFYVFSIGNYFYYFVRTFLQVRHIRCICSYNRSSKDKRMKAITRDISSNIISVIFRIYIRFDDDSQKSCIIYLTYCLTVDKKLMGLLHFFF